MRLGFAGGILGEPGLPSFDGRRGDQKAHLSVSLAHVRDIFGYLERKQIKMYRLSTRLVPGINLVEGVEFEQQMAECREELIWLGRLARQQDLRLSFHARIPAGLDSPTSEIAAAARREIERLALLLDAMELGLEAVIVTHPGAEIPRAVAGILTLSRSARARVALENGDRQGSLLQTRDVARQVDAPVVFDVLHHLNCNPEHLSMHSALALALHSWRPGIVPKVHYSSPRTELRYIRRRDPTGGRIERFLAPPLWNQHADYINPFEFMAFRRMAKDLPDFDVLVEARAGDLAVLQLAEDMERFETPGDIVADTNC
ncbi:MAG: hypothetical protein HY326_03825 [Chloroflexi bacterium]|nr:hypothetical protein [Chloroflexota bacterium]